MAAGAKAAAEARTEAKITDFMVMVLLLGLCVTVSILGSKLTIDERYTRIQRRSKIHFNLTCAE